MTFSWDFRTFSHSNDVSPWVKIPGEIVRKTYQEDMEWKRRQDDGRYGKIERMKTAANKQHGKDVHDIEWEQKAYWKQRKNTQKKNEDNYKATEEWEKL